MTKDPTEGRSLAYSEGWHDGFEAQDAEIIRPLRAEIERLTAILNYVADMTYCGTDAEWHFKPGYDPQIVLDALELKP
jgi:hypothetical protein